MKYFMKLIVSLSLLVLWGCASYTGSYEDELNRRVERAVTCEAAKPNYSHGVYSYYKEPLLGRISSEETSNTFVLDDVKFVMNLRISSIINQKYYSDAKESSGHTNLQPAAQSNGTFLDFEGKEHPFQVTLYRLNDSIYTYASSDQAEFFAISGELEALQLAEAMIRMARSIRVDNDAVIAAYSSRQTIEYSRKRLELFQNIVPENGVIEELFEGYGSYAGQADGEYYGDNYNDDTVESENLDFSQGDEQLDETSSQNTQTTTAEEREPDYLEEGHEYTSEELPAETAEPVE